MFEKLKSLLVRFAPVAKDLAVDEARTVVNKTLFNFFIYWSIVPFVIGFIAGALIF